MKQTLVKLLISCAVWVMSPQTRADVAVTVHRGAAWQGVMNVFELPANGGAFVFNGVWGSADLVATFSGPVLSLAPNTIGVSNEFWYQEPTMMGNPHPGGLGAPGNKIMDANMYRSFLLVFSEGSVS